MTNPQPPSVRLTRWFKAPPQRVFDAWTHQQQIARWLSPNKAIKQVLTQVDARVGGAFRFGYANPDTGHVNTVAGKYLVVDPPRRLVFTWAWLPPHDEFSDQELAFDSTVTVELTNLDGGTQIILTHEKLPTGPITQRHIWGWTGALDRLVELFPATQRPDTHSSNEMI